MKSLMDIRAWFTQHLSLDLYQEVGGGRWGEEVQYSNGANPAAVVPHSRFRLRDSCEISVMEHPQRSTKLNFLKSNLQEVTSC